MREYSIDELARAAGQSRRLALAAIHAASSGHPGGVLSVIDLLTALFFRHLNYRPQEPDWPARDRCILSKGHAAPALYAVAALAGLAPVSSLENLRKLGHPLQGHPHVGSTPWVETSTGSLGQGISAAVGMAMGLRHQGMTSRVYALLGDGEMQEGEVWEALMCAAHYRLDNLCALLDYNKLQSDDANERIMGLEPIADKVRAFGWRVEEIDGHDLVAIDAALTSARQAHGRPTFIVAHTIKGKGVEYMEGRPEWHGSVKLRDDDLVRALANLGVAETDTGKFLDGSIWKC